MIRQFSFANQRHSLPAEMIRCIVMELLLREFMNGPIENMGGWFCAAPFWYFDESPEEIHVKAEATNSRDRS